MYLSGYYPIMGLNDSTGSGIWPSPHENKTFTQYYGLLSTHPETDEYKRYDKEQLRQTILKHEMIFRQQLHELHRLYKIQASMMNQARSKEPQQYCEPNGILQSRFFAIPSQGKSSVHDYMAPGALGACSIQSHLSSKDEKLEKRLFDLELPAVECVTDEEEGKVSNEDALSSCVDLRRNLQFTDLNEPPQCEEESGTASVDIVGNITSSRDDVQRPDLSATSCSGNLVKEASQSPAKGKDSVGLCNAREQSTRKTIFSVEISDTNHRVPFTGKQTGPLHPFIFKSNVAISELSSISQLDSKELPVKPELFLTDLNYDPVPYDYEEVSVDCKDKLRGCIDLNVKLDEEDPRPDHFSSIPKRKIVLDIDLEAPVDLETDTDNSKGEFTEINLTKSFDTSKDETWDGTMKSAADTLIALSSSVTQRQDYNGSLQLFAEIVSSCKEDVQSESEDYFEYMTLNLPETKLEDYHYKAKVVEVLKKEVGLPSRPRRGQTRRGRQRKDFQRDVLPGIVSLSRNDVTEDLQIIEGLIRETGATWEPSLLNSSRARGRGRKRLSAPILTTPTHSQPEPEPQFGEVKCVEVGSEETGLTGWGKRTRRPPRPRCLINHAPSPLL